MQIAWSITQLNCKPQENGKTNVVVVAVWQCVGVDGAYTAKVYGTANFIYAPENSFTPYDQLTQEQVLNWCWGNGVDKDATEANVEAQLEAQVNPPVISPTLPWATEGA
jgi:hypothetical protein